MARLPLAGQSYTNSSLAAAAQQTMNFLVESIEDANGSGKSAKFLRGFPGVHLLANLNAHTGSVRGIWSGGGRCFVVVGSYLYEVLEAGTIAPGFPHHLPSVDDGKPVYMFGNGNQLGIVADGWFLVDNGAGIDYAYFQIQGTVSVSGSNVTWTSGDQWDALIIGRTIVINGQNFTVASSADSTHLVITGTLAGGSGTASRFTNTFFWVSGDLFDDSFVGLQLTFNGNIYTVAHVQSAYVLDIVEMPPGTDTAMAYSVDQVNNPYSADAGAHVTALTGAYLDGQAYVQRPQGGTPDLGRTVNFSAVNDFTVWNGLDFFQKEGGPDYIQSILADREQLYVFGTQVDSEVWQNDPNTGRPVRVGGAVAQEGSACRYVPVSMQEHIYFMGQSPGGGGVAYRVDGYTPTRISTHAIEEQWNAVGLVLSNCVAWWMEIDGHFCWVITFNNFATPGASSWVYDATERQWSELATWNGTQFTNYPIHFHAFIPEWNIHGGVGSHVVGAYNSAKIYLMDMSYGDFEGGDVVRRRALPYLFNDGKRIFVGRVQMTADTGEVASGAAPTIALDWSEDNGHTFSTPDVTDLGVHGEYNKEVYWLAQGSFLNNAIPRFTTTGQAVITLISVDAEVSQGTT